MRGWIISALAALALAASAPACADIAAYNKAVAAGDYKAAAAAAAETWPQFDKTTSNATLIAREFGYIAYIAKDFEAMRTYAAFAADPAAPGNTDAFALAVSTVLLRNAEHQIKPTATTRKALYDALAQRSAHPGVDNITIISIDALAGYDMANRNWKDAIASTQLGAKLVAAGGSSVNLSRRRFELFNAVATFLDSKTWDSYGALDKLNDAIMTDMDKAPNEATAKAYVPLRWEVFSWRSLVSSYLISSGKRLPKEYKSPDKDEQEMSPRLTSLLDLHRDERCKRQIKQTRKIEYPPSALYEGFVGSVVITVDVDAQGKSSNPKLLAAVPEKFFSGPVMQAATGFVFKPDPKAWDAAVCKLEHANHVVEVYFSIGG